ncbi:hypothetical protein [Brevibacillus laterosporus]|uniref:hypothetical protein n=1 Tax=Brevibacillus laterosporus TaxID=1465 RepID=UPI0003B1AC09|nr:hypothetical protein [Brevibacillus laterosporus]ERM17763.1 hypothetical protein P615_01360 [Brevibacillus laterosporus PE36]
MEPTIHKKLQHLSINQIMELMERYYNGEKTTVLIKEFNIRITASQLYTLFPSVVENVHCMHCKVPFWTTRSSRTANNSVTSCPSCGHQNQKWCYCPYCKAKREEEEREKEVRKRQLIRDTYDLTNHESIFINDLTLSERLYLAVLLRGGLDENFNRILPVTNYYGQLTPTDELTKELVSDLWNKKIILVHPSSPTDAFPTGDNYPNTFYTYKVLYHVNVEGASDKKQTLKQLLHPKSEVFLDDPNFCFDMWREIALAECIQYLMHSLKKVGFEFTVGEKTIAVINDLLEHFSTAQIWGIIYRSIANATKYYQETRIPKKQAANSVIGHIQRFGERALGERWELKNYGRDFDLPQSFISEIFFNRILQIGASGFQEKPSKERITTRIY